VTHADRDTWLAAAPTSLAWDAVFDFLSPGAEELANMKQTSK